MIRIIILIKMITYHPLVAHGHKGVIQAFLKKKVSQVIRLWLGFRRKLELVIRFLTGHRTIRIITILLWASQMTIVLLMKNLMIMTISINLLIIDQVLNSTLIQDSFLKDTVTQKHKVKTQH
jgi:hypothetical protein